MIARFLDRVRAQPTTWYAVLVVVGFIAFTLGPSLLGMRTLISVHMLTAYLPWQANGVHTPRHEGCTGDTIDAALPSVAYIKNQWLSGHLGNWQSLVSGGSPKASLPDSGLLEPLSLPYLLLPLWLAPAYVKLLEFAAAIGGVFLFLRRVGASRAAGLIAGIVFAASGFMVMWTNWPQTRVAALIPLLFWATERLVQRHRPTEVALIAVIVASMLFGGFPAVTGYGLYFAGLYLLIRVVQLHRADLGRCVRIVCAGAGAVVLGGAVSAIQMLPFASFYSSTNFSYRTAAPPRYSPLSTLLTVFAPESHGLCAGTTPRHGEYPIEAVTFVGCAAILLAVGGAATIRRRGRSVKPGLPTIFLAAAIVALLLGWGGTPLLRAANHLPVFAGNFIGRIRSVLGFFLAVLAGFGFDALLRARQRPSLRPRREWIRPAAVWLAAAVLGAAVLWRSYFEARKGSYLSDVRPTLTAPAILFVIAAVVCAAALIGSRRGRIVAAVVLPLLIAGQSATFFHRVLPGDRPADFYPVTAAHRFLQENVGNDRYDASSLAFYPATSLYYGIRAATGHTFTEHKWMLLLTAADPKVRRSQTFSAFSRLITPQNVGASPVLDRLGVKYFAFGSSSVAGTSPPPAPADGRVAAAADGSVSCTMPGGPIRGLTVTLGAGLEPAVRTTGVTVHATLTVGDSTVSAGRFMATGASSGRAIQVAAAGEDLPPSLPIRVTFTVSGATGPLSLAASGGKAVCTPIRPVADNLKLVYADPAATIYERLTALPRIRWASRSIVVTDPKEQVSVLKAGLSPDTVELGEQGPAASGGAPAAVSVGSGNGDRISATVKATASGYLTVADAMQQPGWSVTVDGKRSTLMPADEALAAVAVPAGTHRVVFSYHPPRQRLGALVTFGGLAAVVVLFLWDPTRRRRRGRSRQPGVGAGTIPDAADDVPPSEAGR